MPITSTATATPAARGPARSRAGADRGGHPVAPGLRSRLAGRAGSSAVCILPFILLILVLCLGLACARPPTPESELAVPPPSPSPSPPPIVEPPPPDPLELPCAAVLRLEVHKRERRLEVGCTGGGLRVFPIALSREPVGAKQRSGDQRIPEGDYRIAGSARASRFELFIPIDYPSTEDADRGLAEGLIGRDVHRRILAAHARGRLPPQDTALGGLVGFHGEGPRWRGYLDLDWTEGCVAVSDDTIRWLARHVQRGTPVTIRP